MNTTDVSGGALLELKDLTIRFGKNGSETPAIDHVSFSVMPGETLAIVGESGSGKSVSSLAIMGLLPANTATISNGTIKFRGETVHDTKQLRGTSVAIIFQEPMTSLNPVMKCGKQVEEMLRHHKGLSGAEAKQKVISLFSEVKLPRPEQLAGSYPHQLSGGQRQRVMIAMALCCEPAVLIADEPTTALDVTVQASILELLKSIQVSRGMSMVFISHDLSVVSGIADHIVVMRKGQVVESGSARQVLFSPSHPYTVGLLKCRPGGKDLLKRLPTIGEIEKGNEFVPEIRIPHDSRGQTPILQVKELTKIYRSKKFLGRGEDTEVKAVDAVTFDVFPGETLGLVGESGCGKTTLSRMLLRLLESTSGSIFFKGKDISQLREEEMRLERKNMQMIFQDPYSSLNPKLLIGTSITEPMRVFSMVGDSTARKKKALQLLDRVGLPATAFDRYPHEFSGGQRQRIVIARALSMEPEFIICDESVSALDVSVQAQVLNLLMSLKEEMGLTYIFISHDLAVIRHMSDRIMVMNAGKIEEIGLAGDVLGHPTSPYTRRLLESLPTFES